MRINERHVVAEFIVVDGGQQCLLGDTTSKELGVLKVGLDINNVEELKPFNKIIGLQVQIHMDTSIKPVFQPLRKVPVPLEAAVNKKLEQLLQRDIIEVKTGTTQWVSPMVVVGKANGEPRLCLDLRRVNEAVLRERYPMPVVDDYLVRMGKNMIRSKLDIREAFLQVELEPNSRDITTFITNKGCLTYQLYVGDVSIRLGPWLPVASHAFCEGSADRPQLDRPILLAAHHVVLCRSDCFREPFSPGWYPTFW